MYKCKYVIEVFSVKKYIGRKIMLNAKDLPVSDILRALAESSGFSIISTKEVKSLPPLSLTLNNINNLLFVYFKGIFLVTL